MLFYIGYLTCVTAIEMLSNAEPEVNKPKPSNNWRKRNNNANKKKPEYNESAVNRPVPKLDGNVPKPTHLSKKPTPLLNEPLYSESFVFDGENGLTYSPRETEFSPNLNGFMTLVHDEYSVIAPSENKFAKPVPRSRTITSSTYGTSLLSHLELLVYPRHLSIV